MPTDQAPALTAVESRSIDYVPLAERHGKPWHLAPVWVMCTVNLVSFAGGVIGVSMGLSLGWSLVAIALGACFGTFFAAFHSTQGPQLGLPQMIQSRPQFGYRGALLVWVLAVLTYVGFSVFGIVLMGDTLQSLLGLPRWAGMVTGTVIGAVIAVFGYDMIHRATRVVTVAFVVVYVTFTVTAVPLLGGRTHGLGLDPASLSWQPFLLQFGVVAASCISWAPYVSDYTRYLHPAVGVRGSFLWTYVGMVVSAIWVAAVAAFAAAAFPGRDVVAGLRAAGDGVFGGLGLLMLVVAFLGTIFLVAMDSYGGTLTMISIADSGRPVTPRRWHRVVGVCAFTAVSLALAFAVSQRFLDSYGSFTTVLLYAFSPWTAVNLVDFFFVRRGRYSIREIFNPRGIYGSWSWRGYGAYLIGFASMVPFFSTTFFTGPVARLLGGGDVAPFVGILVSTVAYLLLTRSLDLPAERRRIAEADAGLEPGEEPATAGEAPRAR